MRLANVGMGPPISVISYNTIPLMDARKPQMKRAPFTELMIESLSAWNEKYRINLEITACAFRGRFIELILAVFHGACSKH